MAKTTNIKFGSGNTDKDGVNAHVAYTPISEAEKNAKMRQLSEDLKSGKKTVPLPSDLMPKGGKRWKI